MKFIFSFCISFSCLSAFAADFKCYSSKYPIGMEHTFQDGYTRLSVKGNTATLEYYYVNTVANETTMEYQASYSVQGLKGGSGKLSNLYVAKFNSSTTGAGIGEYIDVIYLESALLSNKPANKGMVGKFTFSGHAYGYDWNLCYAN